MLILASGSSIRRKMLEDAGVQFEVVRPDVDEAALKAGLDDGETIALELAKAKAAAVSSSRSGDWVIGSDSVVRVEERLFDKPRSREEAADHLHLFSGKPMQLYSAVALAKDGNVEWSDVGRAELHVRDLSEEFIQAYLDAEWPQVGQCVGVFRIEGPGIQLFDRIIGGHFTIMGMPLIPVLRALRKRGVLPS
ncbi:MAG TPA: nucleoside triphosphate pyrophosphatase [Sphingomicrobium sp.]